jgi:hypothetical protein
MISILGIGKSSLNPTPGPGKRMCSGWETKKSRTQDGLLRHIWCFLFRLDGGPERESPGDVFHREERRCEEIFAIAEMGLVVGDFAEIE